MLARILRCREAGVPITNYGLVIAYSLGIFERALAPFPAAVEVYRQALRGERKAAGGKAAGGGQGQPEAITAGLPADAPWTTYAERARHSGRDPQLAA